MADEQFNNDQQIGIHIGALQTLSKEREELTRILTIVEQIMQLHLKGLKDMNYDLGKLTGEQPQGQPAPAGQPQAAPQAAPAQPQGQPAPAQPQAAPAQPQGQPRPPQ